MMSLPSRERGLKPRRTLRGIIERGKSLPSRERGLKQPAKERMLKQLLVAPFTGAWIETLINAATT